MATKKKAHKSITIKCVLCGKKHSKSAHLSHGKGSFGKFPSRFGKTKAKSKTTGRKLTKSEFLRRMNKGRKAKGMKLIRAK